MKLTDTLHFADFVFSPLTSWKIISEWCFPTAIFRNPSVSNAIEGSDWIQKKKSQNCSQSGSHQRSPELHLQLVQRGKHQCDQLQVQLVQPGVQRGSQGALLKPVLPETINCVALLPTYFLFSFRKGIATSPWFCFGVLALALEWTWQAPSSVCGAGICWLKFNIIPSPACECLSFTSFIPIAWHRALVPWFQGCLALFI